MKIYGDTFIAAECYVVYTKAVVVCIAHATIHCVLCISVADNINNYTKSVGNTIFPITQNGIVNM